MPSRRPWRLAVVAVAGLATATLGSVPAVHAASNNNSPEKLAAAVTLDNVMRHVQAFQAISDANGHTRASGTPGFDASVNYVSSQLTKAGYHVTRQPFDFDYFAETAAPILQQVSPHAVSYVADADFLTATFSGSGDVTAPVQGVNLTIPATPEPSSASGCDPADFAGFVTGNIALIQRGTCAFTDKVANAEAAGASAVIIFNEGQPGRTARPPMNLGGPGTTVPVMGASYDVGVALSQGAVAHVSVTADSEVRTTYNLIAQTNSGRTDNVVVAGAHLDALPPVSPTQPSDFVSAAINASGTPSAALLETALQLAKTKVNNAVRFIWWGAGELSEQGSFTYVFGLSDAELANIGAYVDFDSLASRNGVYGVYDGDGSAQIGDVGPDGSGALESIIGSYYDRRGVPHEPTGFVGRSDYEPFILVGVATGGLFDGAEQSKTPEEAAIFGGTAGEWYDPCYHAPCDDINNVDHARLAVNSKVMANVIGLLAFDTSAINGIHTPGKSHNAGHSAYARQPQPASTTR
jgi:Zn-dependent M28 family amino/carboxypeptidase